MSGDGTPLSVSSERREDTVVIIVAGQLDLSVVQELDAALADGAVDGARGVIVDMTELEFMDSSGLRALLLSADRFGTAGLPWAVALGKHSPVRRLLALSGVEDRLPLFTSRDEAVGSLSSGG